MAKQKQPYHANFKKRLTKKPKLYFYDTGLLCHLLHIETTEQLVSHTLFGKIFENLIIAETTKHYFNTAKIPELYFIAMTASEKLIFLTTLLRILWQQKLNHRARIMLNTLLN